MICFLGHFPLFCTAEFTYTVADPGCNVLSCLAGMQHLTLGSLQGITPDCWGSTLEKEALATLTGRTPELWLGSVARLCGWALCPGLVLLLSSVAGLCSVSRPCPPVVLCGWALCPGLVLLLAGPCPPLVLFLSSSCPCLGRAPELCGWALWPGSVSGCCPPLVLVLAAPLNSVAGLSLWPGFLERSVAKQIVMSMPTKNH